MPSSTSTFRQELKVVVVVLVVLACVEGFMRKVWPRFSSELRDIAGYAVQADTLAAADAQRVLILGNSMTVCDLDIPALREQLTARLDRDVAIEAIAMDGAAITEWYHIAKSNFARPDRMPDVIVLNYHVADPTNPASFDWGVRDESYINQERLVYYLSPADMIEAIDAFETFGDKCHFVHGWLCRSVAGRGRIRRLMLSKAVPGYQQSLTRFRRLPQNRWITDKQARAAERAGAPEAEPPTYDRLTKLIGLGADRGTKMILVVMPYEDQAHVDPDLAALAAQRGISIIDLRSPAALTDQMWTDRAHLNDDGKGVFTPIYAEALAPLLDAADAAAEE